MSDRTAIIDFCPMCFASTDDSSGGGEIVPNIYCMNCGGHPIKAPRWAVQSIREQASWVGKRYYPNEEDTERQREIRYFRAHAPADPADEYKRLEADPDDRTQTVYLQLTRHYAGQSGTRSTMMPLADDTEATLEAAKTKLRAALPYPPALAD